MDKKIITIDVSNMSPSEVDDFMDSMMCKYKNAPYVPKSKLNRKITYIMDVLGIWGV